MFKLRLGLCAALCFGLAAGCYKNSYAPGVISGHVRYNNQPVSGGVITFHTEGKGSYSKHLGLDGGYSITDIPTGEVKVTVETESINPKRKPPARDIYAGRGGGLNEQYKKGMGEQAGQPSGKYVPIPGKYAQSSSSPLTYTIEAGSQVKDFDLDP
jgi:hypothetical protein